MNDTFNARIRSTFLGPEDHGIPTCAIQLDHEGGTQGFGGYDLRCYPNAWHQILAVVGAKSWEDLVGKNVRARRNSKRMIESIGHIVEDRWFSFRPEEAVVDA